MPQHRPPFIGNDDVDEPNSEVHRSALIAAFLGLRGSLFQMNGGLRRAAALQGGQRADAQRLDSGERLAAGEVSAIAVWRDDD